MCLFCLLGCAFGWASVWNFDPADWPSAKVAPHNAMVQNSCGRAGAWVAYQLFFFIGPGTYALLICLSGFLIVWVVRGRVGSMWQRSLGAALLVAVTAGSAYLLGSTGPPRPPMESGGIVGVGLGRFLKHNFHWAGTALILLYALLMGALFAGDGLVTRVPVLLRRAGGLSGAALAGAGWSFLRGVGNSVRPAARVRERGRAEPRINPGRPQPHKKKDAQAAEGAEGAAGTG